MKNGRASAELLHSQGLMPHSRRLCKHYDFLESVCWQMRAWLVTLNGGHDWVTVQDAKNKLVAAAMSTRPGLQLEEAKRMVDALFEATN